MQLLWLCVCVCTFLDSLTCVVLVTTGTDIWLGRPRLGSWGNHCLVHSPFHHVLETVDDGLGMLVPNWTHLPIHLWGPRVRGLDRSPVEGKHSPVVVAGME